MSFMLFQPFSIMSIAYYFFLFLFFWWGIGEYMLSIIVRISFQFLAFYEIFIFCLKKLQLDTEF